MDLNLLVFKPNQNELDRIDPGLVNKMLYLRFKLMNFTNNAHDLICNQVGGLFKRIYSIKVINFIN